MADKDKKIIKINPNFKDGSGVACSMSWERFENMLKRIEYLRNDEIIEGLIITDEGIQFYIKTVDK